jgi:nucleoside-diphosphate-sugar epimerase
MLRVAAAGSIPRGAVYNICSGVQSSLKDVVEIAASLMRVGSEPVWASMSGRSWDTNQWVGSPDRTEREIGWRASVSLEAGIRATIEWFQTHPELLSFYSARVFPPELAGR